MAKLGTVNKSFPARVPASCWCSQGVHLFIPHQSSMSAVTQALKRFVPLKKSDLPPVLKVTTGSLYQVLSRTPSGGVGTEVHQTRWSQKQISDSYWVITRSKFKDEGQHGKAWGKLYWKGTIISVAVLQADYS